MILFVLFCLFRLRRLGRLVSFLFLFFFFFPSKYLNSPSLILPSSLSGILDLYHRHRRRCSSTPSHPKALFYIYLLED